MLLDQNGEEVCDGDYVSSDGIDKPRIGIVQDLTETTFILVGRWNDYNKRYCSRNAYWAGERSKYIRKLTDVEITAFLLKE